MDEFRLHTQTMNGTLPVALMLCLVWAGAIDGAEPPRYRVRLTVTTPLEWHNVPLDPQIDFALLLTEAGSSQALNPNSLEVINLATGEVVPHALGAGFADGAAGRVEWVVRDPAHTRYELRFGTAATRPSMEARARVPPIGVGDLLRYDDGDPHPITTFYSMRLVDLDGDGRRDLAGCWNYAYRPGRPWDGVIMYTRTARNPDQLEFGDLVHLRYVDSPKSTNYQRFPRGYSCADFADLDGDGTADVVFSHSASGSVEFFLHSGRLDEGGHPVLVRHAGFARPPSQWQMRAVDLSGDGAVDFVFFGGAGETATYYRNQNPDGWPIRPGEPQSITVGTGACFFDVDRDGKLDAVFLASQAAGPGAGSNVCWRRNEGGDPPQFGASRALADIDPFFCQGLSAVTSGPRVGLLVNDDSYQRVRFYEPVHAAGEEPRFCFAGDAVSRSAVLALGDQAWPCLCDWDGDGDLDLLVGGGYGWPQIVINRGTCARPTFGGARKILASGEPIRILRDEVLGSRHPHNMGYPYPAYEDWDADGLPDLLLPNETNRIFWYRNIGTRGEPKFGERRQVICDGFPDSAEHRAASARLAADRSVPNSPYPYEETRPFFWRTGAAFADFTGDGLVDLVTHDGYSRKATLFARYRDETGRLRLRKEGPLRLEDGRLIDDSIVQRGSHWTESFRPADWDGDGRIDLIYNCSGAHHGAQDNGSIYLLKNVGTRTAPLFTAPVTFRCFGEPIFVSNHGPHACAGDLDGDGQLDLLACVEWSVYPFYRHAALRLHKRPEYQLGSAEPLP